MKNIPLIHRWRELPSGVVTPAEARRPLRFWMTGSLAVVMAAIMPRLGSTDAERATMRLLRHSPFGVTETVLRIESAALDGGLSVLAKLQGSRRVLVLGSNTGGTLVVMSSADALPAMPLGLVVSESPTGGADVHVAAQDHDASSIIDLPASVRDELKSLPGMVDRALS